MVGIPDEEWGQRIAAVVVLAPGTVTEPDELRSWAHEHLRGSRTPEVVEIWDELPYTETGKLLRRVVKDQLTDATTN